MQFKKILLIQPMHEKKKKKKKERTSISFPWGLASLASFYQAAGYEVKILDGQAMQLTKEALLPEIDEDGAGAVAERIRIGVEQHVFLDETQRKIPSMTVTIGISSLPLRAINKRDLIRTADFALYQGKSAGKNRVVLFNQESAQT